MGMIYVYAAFGVVLLVILTLVIFLTTKYFNWSLPVTELFIGDLNGHAAATTVTTTTGVTLPGAGSWQLDTPQDLQIDASPTFANVNVPETTALVGQYKINNVAALHHYNDNNFIGVGAGNFTLTGSNNNGVGREALAGLTTGIKNVAVGFQAGVQLSTGSQNVLLGGQFVGAALTTGSDNIIMGRGSIGGSGGLKCTGNENIALGLQALVADTTGTQNIGIGSQALNTLRTGSDNVAVGAHAGINILSGSNNVALGLNAMYTGAASAGTSSNDNIAIGQMTLASLTSGGQNIAIGINSGNVLTTESNNIYIANTGVAADSGVIRIGTTGTQNLTILAGVVVIGAAAASASTALLDVQSTTQGVRFPNMSTAEKNAITPSAGLVVFDVSLGKLCVANGASWETITSV